MLLYFLVLLTIIGGANFLLAAAMRVLIVDYKRGLLEARGFCIVGSIFINFATSSLAYFWADIRFDQYSELFYLSSLGMLFSVVCNLIGLSIALYYLQGVNQRPDS